MVLVGGKGSVYEVFVDDTLLRHVSEFSYWDVFWVNQLQMVQSVVSRWRMEGKLRLLSDL